jgi:hypothetical protein
MSALLTGFQRSSVASGPKRRSGVQACALVAIRSLRLTARDFTVVIGR